MRLTLGYMVLSPLALSLPQDTSCSPIIVQKLDVAPHAACAHRHLSAFMRRSRYAAEALRRHPVHAMPPLYHKEQRRCIVRAAERPLAASGGCPYIYISQDSRHVLRRLHALIWQLQATATLGAIREKAAHRRVLVNRHAALEGIHLLWGELILLHAVPQPPIAAIACSGTQAVSAWQPMQAHESWDVSAMRCLSPAIQFAAPCRRWKYKAITQIPERQAAWLMLSQCRVLLNHMPWVYSACSISQGRMRQHRSKMRLKLAGTPICESCPDVQGHY